ncbi:hypothetical protein D3C73_1221960 [compost metagenome]
MLLLVIVVAEAVFINSLDRDTHHLLAVRHDYAFIRHQIGQILLDGLADLFLMPCLVLIPLAVQGPVLTGDDKQRFCHLESLPCSRKSVGAHSLLELIPQVYSGEREVCAGYVLALALRTVWRT